jgi:hypothetical protein
MAKRRTILGVSLLAIVSLGLVGLGFFVQSRRADCAYVPLVGDDLLPNAELAPGDDPRMPQGWSRAANGVELRGPAIGNGEGFDYNNNGRALQLIGIGNYAQTPPVSVEPNTSYCFAGKALTDSAKHSATRLRVVFAWRDGQGRPLGEDMTGWQDVVLWQPDARPSDWSTIGAAFVAPAGAATLLVQLKPASDDRVYLDAMHIRQGGRPATGGQSAPVSPSILGVSAARGQATPDLIQIAPWPDGRSAALSFSFDWETAMGGLIHSRSVDDPNASQDPIVRGMRMREGITTTLDLFRPYGIRATYYATGYNFLLGNTERRQFMGNPIFSWADHQISRKWPNDTWTKTPWFGPDPHGTTHSDPAWYFGDLIPRLQQQHQDIQTHTFSHLDGGLATTQQWRDDLATWRSVAAERATPMARSLAFPWSSSAGMSYNDWDTLQAAGITSVTRTKPGQQQYQLANPQDPHCRPVPGHERILACPDFYLHDQASAAQASTLIDHAIAVGGMIDLWAHTEEVASPAQIAVWGQVVRYAAGQRDAGKLWIAPLAEIADWQQAVSEVRIQNVEARSQEPGTPLHFSATNDSTRDLRGLTLVLPFRPKQIVVDGNVLNSKSWLLNSLVLDVRAGQTVEVQAWPV